MSTASNPEFEVRQLADALFDGDLDQAGIVRLEQLIDSSPECLRAYVERLDFHGALLDQADPHTNQQAALLVLQDLSENWEIRASRARIWMMVSSSVCAAVLCGLLVWIFSRHPDQPTPIGSIAHLSTDASSSVGDLELGRVLQAGSFVQLDSGILSIELPYVIVDLIGPAKMKLNSQQQIELHQGTLTARVSPGGEGFTVRTPDAEVVDFGTEFSVHYDPVQGTDVAVRRGRVRSSLLGPMDAMTQVLDLTANRAARLRRQEEHISETVFQPNVFLQVDQARGSIRSVTGQLRTAHESPVSLESEKTTTPNHMLIVPERQNLTLEFDLEVESLSGRLRIPAGTSISSYLVHYDPTALAEYAPRGSIRFFGEIAGVVASSKGLVNTDAIFGLPGTTYEGGEFRGLELTDDTIQVSEDRQTVSFFFRMSPPEYQDQVRILVYSN